MSTQESLDFVKVVWSAQHRQGQGSPSGGAVASIKGKNMPKFKWIVVLVIVMFVISVAINSGK